MRACGSAQRFPLVLCTFNTALHLYTRERRRALPRPRARAPRPARPLRRRPVDAALEDLARDPSRPSTRRASATRPPACIVKNREHFDYDPARQVLFVSMEFEPVGAPGEAWVTPLAHRQFFPQEWEALLHYNGFARARRSRATSTAAPLDARERRDGLARSRRREGVEAVSRRRRAWPRCARASSAPRGRRGAIRRA